jgi:hypothetical protein
MSERLSVRVLGLFRRQPVPVAGRFDRESIRLLDKLPAFKDEWTADQKLAWMVALNLVLDAIRRLRALPHEQQSVAL